MATRSVCAARSSPSHSPAGATSLRITWQTYRHRNSRLPRLRLSSSCARYERKASSARPTLSCTMILAASSSFSAVNVTISLLKRRRRSLTRFMRSLRCVSSSCRRCCSVTSSADSSNTSAPRTVSSLRRTSHTLPSCVCTTADAPCCVPLTRCTSRQKRSALRISLPNSSPLMRFICSLTSSGWPSGA